MRGGRIAVAVAVLAAAACQDRLRGLNPGADPLITIHGRVTASDTFQLPEHLRVGLLWAGVAQYIPFCHDHGPSLIDPTKETLQPTHSLGYIAENSCRDPLSVVPARIGPSVAIDPRVNDVFAIPIPALPEADLMVGRRGARVAYASLIAYGDTNQNGLFDLISDCVAESIPSSDGGVGEPRFLPSEPVFAASFQTLRAPQVRITFVEGVFDASSFFYPSPGCSDLPPPGFSIWEVGPLLEPGASCRVDPADQEIDLVLSPPPDPMTTEGRLTNLACVPISADAFPYPPRDPPLDPNSTHACTSSSGVVVSELACPCPNLQVYTLRGCFSDQACSTPDWNVPAPPGWLCPND